ncbi:hypothetical protein [Paenibacillus sp. 1P07SE]|uniref:hypothetical protein n=1 Tax=Paenibacillus sp. 1P07SE TaxID=3132209 RepID=UPI0039A62DA0
MNQRKQWPGLIRSRRDESGGIVLEAALLLPLVLFVLLFFIFLVQLAAAQMALNDAASQVVRQTAAHLHPAMLAADRLPKRPDPEQQRLPLADMGQAAEALARWLPDPAGALIEAAVSGDWSDVEDMASSYLASRVAEPLLRRVAEPSVLDVERLSVENMKLPDLQGRDEAYLELTVAYDYPLGLPFTPRSLTLHGRVSERVWIPDAVPSDSGRMAVDDAGLLQIIGIQPDPVRPGRKARLSVRTDPGAAVVLAVQYKSGSSKARHLGEATADENGYVEWEWHVSGNTTPGTWELSVTGPDGRQVGMHFDVVKANTQ